MAETQYVLTITKQGKKEYIPLPTGGVAAHNQAWSTITDTPTTLLGYGITDGGLMEWPGAGIPLSTGASPWGTSYSTSGSGTVIALAAAPTFTGKVTMSGDVDTGNATDGVNVLLSGKNTVSYSYTLTTNAVNALRLLSSKAGAIGTYWDPNGNIGLGTYEPTFEGAGNKGIHLHNSSAATIELHLTNSATGDTTDDGFSVQIGSTGIAYLIQQENAAMVFYTNNTDRGRILAGGAWTINAGLHVGGTSDPGDNNLLVDGTGTVTGVLLCSTEIRCTGDVIAAYTP